MLSQAEIRQLIHLELPEAEILERLAQLTPERITLPLLVDALHCLQETAVSLTLPDSPVMDCCGTGGSGLPHFNTSTTVAFILAAAGVPVVKFGNRALSSQSGSFDLLTQLGFSEQIDLRRIPEALADSNLVFLFAPQCYPKLAPFNRLRRTIKTRTLFNFLGPLLNPLRPAYRLLGISHADMQKHMADYLAQTDFTERAWLVHGASGLDELETSQPSRVIQIEKQQSLETTLEPLYREAQLLSGTHSPEENLKILMALFQGDDSQSRYYQMVCLNAGAGLVVAGKADSIGDGIHEAQSLLRQGKVMETLNKSRRFYEQFAL